jgi:hypothetical protein
MEKRLPKLKSFRYGIGPWGSQNHFEDDVLNKGVGRKGYICFDKGLGPSSWIENERGCELAAFGFPVEEFENDRAAYNRLIDTIAVRET